MGQVKKALALVVGTVTDFAMPHLGREIDAGRNTTRAVTLKRAILHSRMQRAQISNDPDRAVQVLNAFWRGAAGDRFHIDHGQASFEHFLANHAWTIEALDEFVRTSGLGFSRLVEVGCGIGASLSYCAEKLPWAREAVGIDINAEAVGRAAAGQPPGSRLRFQCADAQGWLSANPQAGTVMISNGGVLEYFSQEHVDRLFEALALARPAAILLLEPVDDDCGLDGKPDSRTFTSVGGVGSETTFSHNYRARLQQAGFEVVLSEDTRFNQVRGVIMLGVLR
jgi:SAM-dependent methyltransferase